MVGEHDGERSPAAGRRCSGISRYQEHSRSEAARGKAARGEAEGRAEETSHPPGADGCRALALVERRVADEKDAWASNQRSVAAR
jgi:hypothetical protein